MEFYRAELKKAPRAIEYLKGRGLTGEIAARFRIGYAPDDWQGLKDAFPDYEHKSLVDAGLVIANEGKRYDRFRDRIMFPILNARGAVIGFGGRVMRPRTSPNTSTRRKRRCSRRAAKSTAWCRRATRCAPPAACWWSRATWTWSRSRSSASATRWRRSAPRPRRCTCRSCCA